MAKSETKMDQATEGEAPVDGELDAKILDLGLAIEAAGIELGEGLDPVKQAIEIVGRWKELMLERAQILVFVAEMGNLDPTSIDDLAGATGKLFASIRGELDKLKRDLDVAEKRLAEANGGELPAPPPRGSDARKIGPDAKRMNRSDLTLLLAENAKLELVFSDGDKEIMEFEPVYLNATDLHRSGSGFMLMPALTVKGCGGGQSVAGAGLLHDGKQISYCRFERPIHIPAGQTRQFHRAIRFD